VSVNGDRIQITWSNKVLVAPQLMAHCGMWCLCYASTMTNTIPSSEIPNAVFEYRKNAYQARWIILTAHRIGSGETVTVEMSLDQWIKLAPVQYVVKLELSQQQPRRPRPVTDDSARTLPVPQGYIEWKDGQNWVVLTAYRAGTEEAVTVEMTLGQWLPLKPVRAAVRDGLDNWQDRKMPKW
jgi:hypothetical protein